MRPTHRSHVNKGHSASKFRHQAGRAKAANFSSPNRGGWRL